MPLKLFLDEYCEKVDIWALGCLAFQLVTGRTPFEDSGSFEELYTRISAADFNFPAPEDVDMSLEAKLFMQSLLSRDPAQRPSAGKALAHPWLSCPTSASVPSLTIPASPGKRQRAVSGVSVQFDEETGALSPVFPVSFTVPSLRENLLS